MKLTEQTEYNKGFKNGQESFVPPKNFNPQTWDRLIEENYKKAQSHHDSPLVSAYWKGWIDGRNALPVVG